MTNIRILVIGSVTTKQYEPLRLQELRKGHKPAIIRMEADDLLKILALPEEEDFGYEDAVTAATQEIIDFFRPQSPFDFVIIGFDILDALDQDSLDVFIRTLAEFFGINTSSELLNSYLDPIEDGGY